MAKRYVYANSLHEFPYTYSTIVFVISASCFRFSKRYGFIRKLIYVQVVSQFVDHSVIINTRRNFACHRLLLSFPPLLFPLTVLAAPIVPRLFPPGAFLDSSLPSKSNEIACYFQQKLRFRQKLLETPIVRSISWCLTGIFFHGQYISTDLVLTSLYP